MKQFLVNESERIEILNRHRSLLNEQTVTDRQRLEAGHKAGCFGTYPVPNSQTGLLASGQAVFSKPSKSKPGELVRFLPNNTYYFYNPTTKQSTQAFKNPNACPAMENLGKPTEDQVNNDYLIKLAKDAGFLELAELRAKGEKQTDEINNPAVWEKKGPYGNVVLYKKIGTTSGGMNQTDAQRSAWIDKLSQLGYEVNPENTEKEGMIPVRLYGQKIPGLPETLFDADQIVYIRKGQTTGSRLAQSEKEQDVDRKTCKDRIENFYNRFLYSKGRPITDITTLNIAKDEAQFCKNKYEGKWGIGGGKFDEMIQLLSGRRTGGPSSSGNDSIFRLQ